MWHEEINSEVLKEDGIATCADREAPKARAEAGRSRESGIKIDITPAPTPIMPWLGYSSGNEVVEPKESRPVRSTVPLPVATTSAPTWVSVTVYVEAWAIPVVNNTRVAVMQGINRRVICNPLSKIASKIAETARLKNRAPKRLACFLPDGNEQPSIK